MPEPITTEITSCKPNSASRKAAPHPVNIYVRVSKTDMVPTGRKITESTRTVSGKMKPVSVLPDKYGSAITTPFSFTVGKKKNIYDIVIEY